ncbi:hypothetical protein TRIATDRAFT_290350 [Trichoderma atroviride IMI 206040]|uniref:Uncharacterized protein n=1 Tax=Hypocrea atroviridis (strain ATCC 20476 / IMI 206040) TaxID=452589 RepID=G9NLP3_HYPAI|nr:uncharacterized protein TRIATDRAFT_290350 [Trichoderma atroviride IMI 206040]EHK48804.1 hypothetical protein TRIATDRAFT_290350 [Trichoderma atroviride IMI 206040]
MALDKKPAPQMVQSAVALFQGAKGYPERPEDKAQPWKKWFNPEPQSDNPVVVLVPSKYDFGSANLGGF